MKEAAINRRKFIGSTGLGALAFKTAGATVMLTPRAARAAGIDYRHLAPDHAALLAAFADHVLPGAAAAGVAHFVDQQLGVTPNECLLMCKYFPEIRAPFQAFYGAGLAALRATVAAQFTAPFEALDAAQKNVIVDALWRGDITPWDGPPPPLFYMMVRSDAVDVVYGTQDGFDELNVPYLAHIVPPEKW